MKDRIKEIRKNRKLTREQFAAPLVLSANYIYLLESGSKPISDKVVFAICEKYGINEEWLRFGTGPMDAPLDRPAQIAKIADELLADDDGFKTKLVDVVVGMSDEQIAWLRDVAQKLADEKLP